MKKRRRQFESWPVWAAAAILLVILFVLFPPFHVVRLRTDATAGALTSESFDAKRSAQDFWDKLPQAKARAVETGVLLPAIRQDVKAAITKFCTKAGIGSAYFLLKGSGRVTKVDRDLITLALDDPKDATIVFDIGPLMGNIVRDGSGLLDINSFANSQQFNDLSAEINTLVEARVLTPLRQKAVVNQAIEFVGCAEASDDLTANQPLHVVPVSAVVK